MALVYDLERDVRFRQGRQRGMLEGERKGLLEGERKGLLEGIELGLELKFGSEGVALMSMVRVIDSIDKLEDFKNHIRKAASSDELKEFLMKE